MEISDIVSPTYSIASNILKLNSSSIASSTPSCHPLGPLVHFQQFEQSQVCERPSHPKKKLTIQIGEPYDFQHQSSQGETPQNQMLLIVTPQSQTSEPLRKQSKIHQNIEQLTLLLTQSLKTQELLQCQNQELKQTLKKKDDFLLKEQQINTDLVHKLAQFEQIKAQEKFYDEKMREKQTKYKELQKIHQKVVLMNRNLQKDLRESEKKILDLQKEVQKNICCNQQENLVKIKQSSSKLKQSYLKLTSLNKENAFSNCGKSVERKKGTSSQVKKTGRSSNSSANLAKKLQIKNALL